MVAAKLQSMRPVGSQRGPRGLTLTELLVAATLSLVVMAAVAGLFGLFGRAIKQSESTMNVGGLMRSAAWQLRQDLAGATCQPTPWLAPETSAGYFELIEGPARDSTYAVNGQNQPTNNLTADTDDLLLFTTQSLTGAFVGRFNGQTIESSYAEIAWFCRPAATQPVAGSTLYDLHRRQLLILGYLGRSSLVNNALPLSTDRAACDISLRSDTIADQGQVLLPNSLGDLTKREHRFMRGGYAFLLESGVSRSVAAQKFPYAFPVDTAQHAVSEASLTGTKRASEDVVLTNVIGFDVRVFDPQATLSADGRVPGDPGYVVPPAGSSVGAYVDLGWGGGIPGARTDPFPPAGTTAFQSAGVMVSGTNRLPTTYDTWSRHYEFNEVDEDGDGKADEGLDDAIDNETSPPYPVPLRGVEVRIRCYEPSSRQIRQVTIRHSFVK
jgi:type II secretory pathway pseudopilin PulG